MKREQREERRDLEYRLCPYTGKRCYMLRAHARTARQRHPDRTLRIYRCRCGDYHLGHLNVGVIAGDSSRAQVYS